MISHRDLSSDMRQSRGITDNLIRLSVGLETPEDLENYLIQALSMIRLNIQPHFRYSCNIGMEIGMGLQNITG